MCEFDDTCETVSADIILAGAKLGLIPHQGETSRSFVLRIAVEATRQRKRTQLLIALRTAAVIGAAAVGIPLL